MESNYNPKGKGNLVVIDTSSLIHDPACLSHYKDNIVIITSTVLQELDKVKDKLLGGSEAVNIRKASKALEWFSEQEGNISEGILNIDTGVTVRFVAEDLSDLPAPLDPTKGDDRILGTCIKLKQECEKNTEILLITNDILLGLRAAMYSISTSKYQQNLLKLTKYTGHREEPIPETPKLLVDDLHKANIYQGTKVSKKLKLQENEFCRIKGGASGNSEVRCYHRNGNLFKIPRDVEINGISALNNEQAYAMQLLMDPDVKMVTLTGRAGSGKTLISIAAALAQVIGDPEYNRYSKVVLSRSLTVMGGKDKLGFLPGDLSSKLRPFIMPLQDAIDFVMGDGNDVMDYMTDDSNKNIKPIIEIEPLQYIRGRNIRNSIMIVDEAQNLSIQDVKTIVTRISDDSKIILLGDLDQIDNYYVSRTSNGLAQTIEKFKDSELVGHIQLVDGVRSALATEAADRL